MKKTSNWGLLITGALLAHAYFIMSLDTRVTQLETIVKLTTEISSKHTKLLTGHEDKIATSGSQNGG